MPTLPESLLLHSSTRHALAGYLKDPAHATLLVGPVGAGKRYLTILLADELSGKTPDKRILVDSDDSTLKIEQIRMLKEQLKLRSVAAQNRTVLIPDADRLTTEAQNALLKLLEEPPENSYFILSVTDKQKLLPTVVSRCSVIDVRPVSKDEFLTYMDQQGYSATAATKAYAVSDGNIGLAVSLLKGDTSISPALDQAKQLLSQNLLSRLKQVDALSKNKNDLPDLLFGLERVLLVGMHTANTKHASVDAWVHKLEAVETTQNALKNNVTTRLALTNLMLNL